MKRVQVIDSHTGGEPTRVVISGAPDLGGGSAADQLKVFRERHDAFRRAVVCEPRGSDVLVGALLVEPSDKTCVTGVIYFDNVTFLGMCGHGTIGLVTTLAHLGRIQPGEHRIETPVGVVTVTLNDDGSVSLTNIPAYRKAKDVTLEVPGLGSITGEVAWGGNWFFFTEGHGLSLDVSNTEKLTDVAWRIRLSVNAQGFSEVDHIVLLGPPQAKEAHSRNFVLCPGKAYDRSPCGTGTSARLACLAADGLLAEGQAYVQESVIGSRFTGSFRWLDRAAGKVTPHITGTAHLTGEATLLLDEHDPFCWGIGAQGAGAQVSNLRVSESEPTGSNAQDGLLRSDSAIRPAARRRDAQIVAEKRRRHSPPVPEAERTAGFAGWHSRGYLPHFDRAGVCQFITFRLADAFPASKRREWRQLLEIADERERLIHLEDWLDAGHGGCVLKRAGAAEIVQRVLQKFDGERYRLCGWVVMPNHVHVLIEAGGIPLARVLHSWKAFTALEINRLTGRSGRLWQVEYFDRYIRDGEHFRKALRYIENNPVKAGLVKAPEDWQWSSARTVDPAIDRSAGVHPARALAAVYAGEISSASPSEQQRAG